MVSVWHLLCIRRVDSSVPRRVPRFARSYWRTTGLSKSDSTSSGWICKIRLSASEVFRGQGCTARITFIVNLLRYFSLWRVWSVNCSWDLRAVRMSMTWTHALMVLSLKSSGIRKPLTTRKISCWLAGPIPIRIVRVWIFILKWLWALWQSGLVASCTVLVRMPGA